VEARFRNDMQQEVIRGGVVCLRGDWTVGGEGGDHDCRLEVERLQIDNQLQDAVHPVILSIAPPAPASSADAAAAAAVSLVATNDFLHIRRCRLSLQPLALNVDWVFVSQATPAPSSHPIAAGILALNLLSLPLSPSSAFVFLPRPRPPPRRRQHRRQQHNNRLCLEPAQRHAGNAPPCSINAVCIAVSRLL
jgi:hypothetical protein